MNSKINTHILKLEKHLYAPELNKVHLIDGKVLKVPYMTTISNAINYCKNHHINYFKNI